MARTASISGGGTLGLSRGRSNMDLQDYTIPTSGSYSVSSRLPQQQQQQRRPLQPVTDRSPNQTAWSTAAEQQGERQPSPTPFARQQDLPVSGVAHSMSKTSLPPLPPSSSQALPSAEDHGEGVARRRAQSEAGGYLLDGKTVAQQQQKPLPPGPAASERGDGDARPYDVTEGTTG